jgi:hypothetical protein
MKVAILLFLIFILSLALVVVVASWIDKDIKKEGKNGLSPKSSNDQPTPGEPTSGEKSPE